jgi:hypothetical protein
MNSETHFKDWAKPGPIPPGLVRTSVVGTARWGKFSVQSMPATGAPLEVEPHETLDAISGHFRIVSTARRPPFFHRRYFDGVVWHDVVPDRAHRARPWQRHRNRRDDLRVASARRKICDGRGAKRKRCARQKIGALQRTEQSLRNPRRRFSRAGNFSRRRKIRFDHRQPAVFSADGGRESEHPQKLACRFELRGTIADYCATAARHLAPGGFFACVFPHEPAQLARVESAAKIPTWSSSANAR